MSNKSIIQTLKNKFKYLKNLINQKAKQDQKIEREKSMQKARKLQRERQKLATQGRITEMKNIKN